MTPRDRPPGEVIHLDPTPGVSAATRRRQELTKRRRDEALKLWLSGVGTREIADRLKVTSTSVASLVEQALAEEPVLDVVQLRALENARLDRTQEAIWPGVLEGNVASVEVYLKIATRRAKLNGLDAPTRIDLSIGIRAEMQAALDALEATILGEVVHDAVEG